MYKNPARELRDEAEKTPGGYPLDMRDGTPVTLSVNMEPANGGNEGVSDGPLALAPTVPCGTKPSSNAGSLSEHGLG